MLACNAIVFAFALCTAPAPALKVATSAEHRGPCPFGYGSGCGGVDPEIGMETAEEPVAASSGKLDAATRDQVAHILEGIMTKMVNRKEDLVQSRQRLGRVMVSDEDQQAKTMSMKVGAALKGILMKLQGTKQAAAGEALARMLAAGSPPDAACTYYGVCGLAPNAPIDAETKAQVGHILEGILGNLQSHKEF